MINKEKIKSFAVKLVVFVCSFLFGMFLARVTKAQEANSLLWEISGKDLKESSYLYGTIHAICPEDFFVRDKVVEALEKSDLLVLELDYDDPQFIMKMQQAMINPGMKNISGALSEEQLAAVNAYFTKNYGSDLTQLGVIKPFGLSSMVIQKSVGCPHPASYEQELTARAQARELEVIGLETIAFQMGIFDSLTMERQIRLLMETIEQDDTLEEEFTEMVAIYKKEDINELYEVMSESVQYADLSEVLLDDRNKTWIPQIEEIASEQPTFFAVGALHLGGDLGVINLLRDASYEVEPIPAIQ